MRRFLGVTLLAAVVGCADSIDSSVSGLQTVPLLEQFKQPEKQYGPHVWWHWMNGDVDFLQAQKDLEWLSAQGIAGVQVFDAGMGPAPLQPLEFGSDDWRIAIKHSAAIAQSLNMDFVITTSPGWSATGGPWVKSEQAMKKWVWSNTAVSGGQTVTLDLPAPPKIAGPYQDIPTEASGHSGHNIPTFFEDVKVIAYPSRPETVTDLKINSSHASEVRLTDGKLWPAESLSVDATGMVELLLEAEVSQLSYGVTFGLPGPRGFGAPNPPIAKWYKCETDDYEQCDLLATLPGTRSLTRTAAYAPVTARYFKLTLEQDKAPGFIDRLGYTQGAVRLPFPSYASEYQISEIKLHLSEVIHHFEEKAGFAAAQRYYPLTSDDGTAQGIKPDTVLDITRYVDSNGRLSWPAPDGNWQIVRLGYSLTGSENGPAQKSATGLEVDKLDPVSVRDYLSKYFSYYQDDNGQFFPGITGVLSDSIESGAQNASMEMLDSLERQLDYKITPWLPALTGAVVGSSKQSDQFLYDVRRYISDTLVSAHYATIAQIASKNNLQYYTEALEDHRPQLGNDLDIRLAGGIPMAAFWYFESDKAAKPTYIADLKGAASVATLKGEPIVAVEAMTTFGHPWAVGPKELRRVADQAFVNGGNRLMLHSSVHQSDGVTYTTGKPMMPLLGHYFNRNNTWSSMAKPWVEYLSRSQFLLQQGYPSASFGYFIGDEAPVTGLFGDEQPTGIPAGYDYDYLSAKSLDLLTVTESGEARTKLGTKYQFIFLGGDSQYLTLTTLNSLYRLASQGLVIVGPRPLGSPSLNDDPEMVHQMIETLWADNHVYEVSTVADAIAKLQLKPQYILSQSIPGSVKIETRTLAEGKLYFVVNTHTESQDIQLELAESDVSVVQFNAVTGVTTEHFADSGQLGITLEGGESMFYLVVSDNLLTGKLSETPRAAMTWEKVLSGTWHIEADKRFGSPPTLTLDTVAPISELEDKAWQGYSGVTGYQTTFELTKDCPGRLSLIAEEVSDIATILINGKEAGHFWTTPYEINITDVVQPGLNSLHINVANYWVNQLIAQAKSGKAVEGFPANVYQQDAIPRLAGLKGDIKLVCTVQ